MLTATAPVAHPPPPRSGGRRSPRLRAVGVLLGVLLAAAGLLGRALLDEDHQGAPAAAAAKPDWARASVTAAGLADRLGVRLTWVAVTGDGGLLDLRFQVVDPDKAAAIHDPTTPPAIVAENSGLFLDSLLMGHSHSGPFKTAVTYYLLFENDGNLVARGSRVTVLLGNVQVQHVVVR
jgi:hypothetical protein